MSHAMHLDKIVYVALLRPTILEKESS